MGKLRLAQPEAPADRLNLVRLRRRVDDDSIVEVPLLPARPVLGRMTLDLLLARPGRCASSASNRGRSRSMSLLLRRTIGIAFSPVCMSQAYDPADVHAVCVHASATSHRRLLPTPGCDPRRSHAAHRVLREQIPQRTGLANSNGQAAYEEISLALGLVPLELHAACYANDVYRSTTESRVACPGCQRRNSAATVPP